MARKKTDSVPTIDNPPPFEVVRTETRHLRCRLTDEEHREKGVALARALNERNELEARRLEYDVRDRSEERPVECEIVHNYEKSIVETVRTDTGEVVSTRPMLESERQRQLV